MTESAGHAWRRVHTGQRGTFSPTPVAGQKPSAISLFQMPVWQPLRRVRSFRPLSNAFGHAPNHDITRPRRLRFLGSSTASTPPDARPLPRDAGVTPSGIRTG